MSYSKTKIHFNEHPEKTTTVLQYCSAMYLPVPIKTQSWISLVKSFPILTLYTS